MGMCVCVSACPAQMDWSTFFHVQKGNFLRWGSERLPGWFVSSLTQFGNIKNKQARLEECRPYILISIVMASNRKEKKRPEKEVGSLVFFLFLPQNFSEKLTLLFTCQNLAKKTVGMICILLHCKIAWKLLRTIKLLQNFVPKKGEIIGTKENGTILCTNVASTWKNTNRSPFKIISSVSWSR